MIGRVLYMILGQAEKQVTSLSSSAFLFNIYCPF